MSDRSKTQAKAPAPSTGELSDEKLIRYAPQIMLAGFDIAGQQALEDSHILIIGLGGLGSSAALYLAAAGVGELTLADDDQVESANLQRQIIHAEASLGTLKVASAKTSLNAINSDCRIHTLCARMNETNLKDTIKNTDLILDCCDNFTTRYHINRACIALKKPWVSAAAVRTQGQLSLFDPRQSESPCYRCLHPNPPKIADDCATNGVLGPLVGVFGSLQAAEAIKFIIGLGVPLIGQLLTADLQDMDWHSFRLPKRSNCPDCGDDTRG